MTVGRALWVALACLALPGQGHAGRPMATDDTGTVAAGECQIEIWGEHTDAERAQVLAPACGLTDTLELDLGASRTVGSGAKVTGLAAGLKWVPAEATFETPLGTVGLGLEGGLFWARDVDQGWRADSLVLVALGSLAMGPQWNLYANVLASRSLSGGSQVYGLRTALSWQPEDRWLFFAEALAASDSSRVRNAGLRWWAVPELIGLDLITSHSTASGTSVSVGLGWYGIRLP